MPLICRCRRRKAEHRAGDGRRPGLGRHGLQRPSGAEDAQLRRDGGRRPAVRPVLCRGAGLLAHARQRDDRPAPEPVRLLQVGPHAAAAGDHRRRGARRRPATRPAISASGTSARSARAARSIPAPAASTSGSRRRTSSTTIRSSAAKARPCRPRAKARWSPSTRPSSSSASACRRSSRSWPWSGSARRTVRTGPSSEDRELYADQPENAAALLRRDHRHGPGLRQAPRANCATSASATTRSSGTAATTAACRKSARPAGIAATRARSTKAACSCRRSSNGRRAIAKPRTHRRALQHVRHLPDAAGDRRRRPSKTSRRWTASACCR